MPKSKKSGDNKIILSRINALIDKLADFQAGLDTIALGIAEIQSRLDEVM